MWDVKEITHLCNSTQHLSAHFIVFVADTFTVLVRSHINLISSRSRQVFWEDKLFQTLCTLPAPYQMAETQI